MDRFAITNDLLTGADDIDAQHRQLFHLANQVVESTDARGTDGQFYAALSFLSDYIHYHFAAEELAMRQSAYPGIDAHLSAHAEFRGMIGEIVELALESKDTTALKQRLNEAITGWLTLHIGEVDKALAAYLRAQMAESAGQLPSVDELIAAGAIDEHAATAARHPSAISRLKG